MNTVDEPDRQCRVGVKMTERFQVLPELCIVMFDDV